MLTKLTVENFKSLLVSIREGPVAGPPGFVRRYMDWAGKPLGLGAQPASWAAVLDLSLHNIHDVGHREYTLGVRVGVQAKAHSLPHLADVLPDLQLEDLLRSLSE